jgi:DNA-binding MarR family transcriptional regulator
MNSLKRKNIVTAASLTKQDYEKLAEFRHALRKFFRFSEHAATELGLPPQQHQALLAIQGFPGRAWVNITELKERLQLEHHSTVGLVNRLARRKLVMREHALYDKRQVNVRLTEQGKETLRKLSAAHRSELKRIGPELSRMLEDIHETRQLT